MSRLVPVTEFAMSVTGYSKLSVREIYLLSYDLEKYKGTKIYILYACYTKHKNIVELIMSVTGSQELCLLNCKLERKFNRIKILILTKLCYKKRRKLLSCYH
jgi:hypothetical protein